MAANADAPAIVLGGGITALGVLRSLARAKVPTFLHLEGEGFVRYSRHFRAVQVPAGAPDPRGDLEGWLAALPFDRAVLLPCSDHWVQRVARLAPEVRARFPASVPAPEVLARFVDKAAFAELAALAAVPHPETWPLAGEEDLGKIPDAVFESAFLKPRDSQAFFARYGEKAVRVVSRTDAQARLRRMAGSGLRMQLQVYVPGPPTAHVFLDGFADGAGRIRALMARRRLRMYAPDFGNSTYMRSIALRDVAEAAESVRRLVARSGYRGIFSCEFKRDDRDGSYRVLEVNARPWWYVAFATRCGVNVCQMAYRDAQGEPVAEVGEYQVGRACVYPYYDYYAVQELRGRGRASLWDWFWAALTSDQPVWQAGDPLPALVQVWERFRDRARRRFGGT